MFLGRRRGGESWRVMCAMCARGGDSYVAVDSVD